MLFLKIAAELTWSYRQKSLEILPHLVLFRYSVVYHKVGSEVTDKAFGVVPYYNFLNVCFLFKLLFLVRLFLSEDDVEMWKAEVAFFFTSYTNLVPRSATATYHFSV